MSSTVQSQILVVANGRVVDPANGIDAVRHIVVRDGIISAVTQEYPQFKTDESGNVVKFDATGLIVCPGLVDLHAHLYTHVTPLGINVDHYCVGRGVTTAVDAGSAGATTLPGLREFIAKPSTTRVLAFLNIALHGLAAAGCTGSGTGGELDSLNQCSTELCVKAVQDNRDFVVGIKIRLSGDAANDGRNEPEAFQRALLASRTCKVPLMTHHTFSNIPLGSKGSAHTLSALGCPGSLGRGDVYTHTFHGFASTIINTSEGKMELDSAVVAARERGVLFDVGHGQGSFNWTVAELCAQSGFWPDIISTDLHTGGAEGPTYDLPTVMTRFLNLGMSLPKVVEASTIAPARAIGWSDRIGSLSIGRCADITVLKMTKFRDTATQIKLEDCQGQLRPLSTRLQAVACWKGGHRCRITTPKKFPNNASKSSADPAKLVVSDSVVSRILKRKGPPPRGADDKRNCC